METAGDLVGAVFFVELAAGVEHRQHDFGGGLAALVHVDGNAAAVVDDGDGVVDVERDVDLGRVSGERFVDRVVDDLVDEVMQPCGPVEPMYMAGRLRTASSPSSTLILSAP